jgi:hypothetical protein
MASSVRFVAGVASVVGVPNAGSDVEMVVRLLPAGLNGVLDEDGLFVLDESGAVVFQQEEIYTVSGAVSTVRQSLERRSPTGPPLELDDVILGVLGQNALGA